MTWPNKCQELSIEVSEMEFDNNIYMKPNTVIFVNLPIIYWIDSFLLK